MFQCTEYAILGHGTTFREKDKHTHTHKFQVSANLGDYMQHVEPFTWTHRCLVCMTETKVMKIS